MLCNVKCTACKIWTAFCGGILCKSVKLTEPPDAEPHVRWCERSAAKAASYSIYDYPEFHLSMDCFWCEVVNGDLVLKEHEAARWLTMAQLNDVEWLPADITLIEKIRKAFV